MKDNTNTKELSYKKCAKTERWGKPKFYYSYTPPDNFTLGTFIKWFKAADQCYRVALEYEAREQSIERVRDINSLVIKKYIHPNCAKFLRYLKTVPDDRIT